MSSPWLRSRWKNQALHIIQHSTNNTQYKLYTSQTIQHNTHAQWIRIYINRKSLSQYIYLYQTRHTPTLSEALCQRYVAGHDLLGGTRWKQKLEDIPAESRSAEQILIIDPWGTVRLVLIGVWLWHQILFQLRLARVGSGPNLWKSTSSSTLPISSTIDIESASTTCLNSYALQEMMLRGTSGQN